MAKQLFWILSIFSDCFAWFYDPSYASGINSVHFARSASTLFAILMLRESLSQCRVELYYMYAVSADKLTQFPLQLCNCQQKETSRWLSHKHSHSTVWHNTDPVKRTTSEYPVKSHI